MTAIQQVLAVRPANADDQGFQSFLRDIEAVALILWAGVRMLRDGIGAADPARDAELDRLSPSALHRRVADLVGPAGMSPATAIRLCERRLDMPARARYNLACFHAMAAMMATSRKTEPAIV